jgi:hypothetical protein
VASSPMVTGIRLRQPTRALAERGLIAWVDCQHGLLLLQGIEVRRTLAGELVISFPPTRQVRGRLSCAAKPVSDQARRAIQADIFAEMTRQGWRL